MSDHLKIVGVLYIVIGSFALILGIFLLLGCFFINTIPHPMFYNSAEFNPFSILFFACLFMSILTILFALIDLIGGINLLKKREWARILIIVMAILKFFKIPVGTAIGIYTIWVLTHLDTKKFFEKGTSTD
jgi:hypothetical protein